jgi:hypothetical protein
MSDTMKLEDFLQKEYDYNSDVKDAIKTYIEQWKSWYAGNVKSFHNYFIYNGNRKLVYEVPHQSTLTQYQISQIPVLRLQYTVKEISKLFNVKYTTLKNIIRKQKQSKILDNQQPNPKYVVGEVQRV